MKMLTWPLTALTMIAATSAVAEDCGQDTRIILHDAFVGERACVPADTTRFGFVEDETVPAYLLGAPVVLMNYSLNAFFEAYPGAADPARISKMTDIGYIDETDPELVAVGAPDILISNEWFPEMNDKLAEIAPVVVMKGDASETDWRAHNRAIAQLVDAEDRLDEEFATLDARIADLRSQLPKENPTYSIVGYDPDTGTLSVWTSAIYSAGVLEQAGFVMAPDVMSPEEAGKIGHAALYNLSLEEISDVDADYIFYVPRGGEEAAADEAFVADPVWNSLTAVQEGNVITASLPWGPHFTRPNVPYAHMVLDEAYRGILSQSPTEGFANPFADWLTARN